VPEIKDRQFYHLEICEGAPYNCKIALAYRKPPLLVSIMYENPNHRGLNFYGSFKHKEPAATANEVLRTGKPTSIRVAPLGSDKAIDFGSEAFFYMTIESDEKLRIRACFADAPPRKAHVRSESRGSQATSMARTATNSLMSGIRSSIGGGLNATMKGNPFVTDSIKSSAKNRANLQRRLE